MTVRTAAGQATLSSVKVLDPGVDPEFAGCLVRELEGKTVAVDQGGTDERDVVLPFNVRH